MNKNKIRTYHCGYCGDKHPKSKLSKTELGEFCDKCLELYKIGELNRCDYCQDLYPKKEIIQDTRNQYCFDCYIELTYYDNDDDDDFYDDVVEEE